MAGGASGVLRSMPRVCGELASSDSFAARDSDHGGRESRVHDTDAGAAAGAGVAAKARTRVGDLDLLRGSDALYCPHNGRAVERTGVDGAAGTALSAVMADPLRGPLFHAGGSSGNSPARAGDASGGSQRPIPGMIGRWQTERDFDGNELRRLACR